MAEAFKIYYASAGAADLIESHRWWKGGGDNPNEVSITFSSQIQTAIREMDGAAYMLSHHPDGRTLSDDGFTFEHRPHPVAAGPRYYMRELTYARGLVRTARNFGARVALLDSGATEFFLMPLFRMAGMKTVVVLHNTLWPHGFRRTAGLRGKLARLERAFFERYCDGVIAVSPEAERQLYELAPDCPCPVSQVRAQFHHDYFRDIPPPPPHGSGPFHVMFIGRVLEAKGVLDLPVMARAIQQSHPGLVRWTICGRGSDYERLKALVAEWNLGEVMDVRGWTSLEDLRQVYAQAHASIVPTRSGFAEGLAMTAAEAILAGRPVVTNPVVPAHELLAPACILGRTNDPQSHADAIVALATDRDRYERMRAACPGLVAPFLDRDQGLAAVLKRMLTRIGVASDGRQEAIGQEAIGQGASGQGEMAR